MEIKLRTVKGTPLTYQEMDTNLSSFPYTASIEKTTDSHQIVLFYTGSTELGLLPRAESLDITPFPYTGQATIQGSLTVTTQLTAQNIVRQGGTASQFLKGDGSVDTTVYKPTFTENTAFNKDFGTTTGTVAQGDDPRIVNGQTAFGWGNHALAGYALETEFHNPVTIGTANGLSLNNQEISLALASTNTTGALSSTDWNTFNSKQNNLGFTPENTANKGQVNGYASLDGGGKVPAGQLPSFVDDVLEFADLASFPTTGETGKIYIAIDSNKTYRWTGSIYVEVSPSIGTDLSYNSTTRVLSSSTGTDVTLPLVTTTLDGLIASGDKVKLDGIANNANNFVHPAHTPISQTLSGATVLATFSTDSIGSVTGFTTRSLTPADIGAAPSVAGGYLPLTLTSTQRIVELNGQFFEVYSSANTFTSGRLIVAPTYGAIGYQTNGVFRGLQILTDGTAVLSNTGTLTMTGALNGTSASFSLDSSFNGVTVGIGSGNINTNTVVGNSALVSNTTGSSNTAFGVNSLNKNTTGSQNTASGVGSLDNNTTGIGNTVNGATALQFNTTGSNNVALGSFAGRETLSGNNTITNNSVYIGSQTRALDNNQTNQIVIGHNTIGNGSNTVTIGNSSITDNYFSGTIRSTRLRISDTGTANPTIIRNTSGTSSSTAGTNVIGFNGTNNIFVTTESRGGFVLGFNNTAIRTYTLPNATGTIALTSDLGAYVTLATTQTITGAKTFSLDTKFNGVNVGRGAGSITTNTAIGNSALLNNTTAVLNTATGSSALRENTTGSQNTAFGSNSLYSNTTGAANTATGVNALFNNETGMQNTAVGNAVSLNNTTGSNNTVVGNSALLFNTTGSNNVALGFRAGQSIFSGDNTVTNNSIYIGSDTRANGNNQTNQIVIGHNVIGLGSNSVVLGNDSITKTILKGDVGIGTTTPSEKLDISGGLLSLFTSMNLTSRYTGLQTDSCRYEGTSFTIGTPFAIFGIERVTNRTSAGSEFNTVGSGIILISFGTFAGSLQSNSAIIHFSVQSNPLGNSWQIANSTISALASIGSVYTYNLSLSSPSNGSVDLLLNITGSAATITSGQSMMATVFFNQSAATDRNMRITSKNR